MKFLFWTVSLTRWKVPEAAFDSAVTRARGSLPSRENVTELENQEDTPLSLTVQSSEPEATSLLSGESATVHPTEAGQGMIESRGGILELDSAVTKREAHKRAISRAKGCHLGECHSHHRTGVALCWRVPETALAVRSCHRCLLSWYHRKSSWLLLPSLSLSAIPR